MEKSLKRSILKTIISFWKILPIIIGTLLLISLVTTLIPKSFYITIFNQNVIFDSLIGSIIGSISAGNPITSYIFGGELLKQGISLIAITAFLVSWVTVGIIQLPAESYILGRKFAILRNLTSFILSIIVAILTVLILKLI